MNDKLFFYDNKEILSSYQLDENKFQNEITNMKIQNINHSSNMNIIDFQGLDIGNCEELINDLYFNFEAVGNKYENSFFITQ